MLTEVNLKSALNFTIDLIRDVGKVVTKYYQKKDLETKWKGIANLVTEADLAADLFIRQKLNKFLPRIPILTEETAPKNFLKLKSNDWLWVVDPIDGTTNFARRDNNFAVSIGLLKKGNVQLGVTFNPLKKRLFYASVADEGAYLNGKRITVSNIRTLTNAIVVTDLPYELSLKDRYLDFFQKTFGKVLQIKILGSAVSDMMLVAEGAIDAYYLVSGKPWDLAASSIIVQKAGGIVSGESGETFNVFNSTILASNSYLHPQIIKLLSY